MLKRFASYIFIILAIGGIMYLTLMNIEATMNLSESFGLNFQ